MEKVCWVSECHGQAITKGLCSVHYCRQRVAGDVKGYLVNCAGCGDYFWTKDKRKRSCSDKCRKLLKYYYNRSYESSNEAKYRAYHEAYRQTNRERLRANQRIYNALHRERNTQYMRNYRRLNPEIGSAWRVKNQSAVLASVVRRRSKKRGWKTRIFEVSDKALRRSLERYRWGCAYCGEPLKDGLHWDHVIPLSKGGVHSEGNLLPTCSACNSSKNASTIQEWLQRLSI